mmetsp:Transcript_30267/g.77172  ORF Transcript_30267/g.77172 Transcript_30267/m.77172 type:complete len:220 (-) Transcript_30267:246-905(-)
MYLPPGTAAATWAQRAWGTVPEGVTCSHLMLPRSSSYRSPIMGPCCGAPPYTTSLLLPSAVMVCRPLLGGTSPLTGTLRSTGAAPDTSMARMWSLQRWWCTYTVEPTAAAWNREMRGSGSPCGVARDHAQVRVSSRHTSPRKAASPGPAEGAQPPSIHTAPPATTACPTMRPCGAGSPPHSTRCHASEPRARPHTSATSLRTGGLPLGTSSVYPPMISP